ncbi:MAG: glyoxalase [Gammaproteobacteria bacterium]|jgi:catechol 2,3-dioxygenase-like lactoylglutathione lyase family enzyme|nr:glyoxalase [Gammaproteobacteria bacterium]HJN95452.1 VOC family protein [Gammaproteobacteria bacterium]|tara:strand:- start:7410 stop:7949 length:540 start_codon:yes stop_codon:yes gene_type:complete
MPVNEKFEIRGVNHLALVCKDMQRTVDFYTGVLGMPLTKTIDLPNGMGQHFFFGIGNGDSLAFFWFPDAPESQPGVTHPAALIGNGSIVSAHASMNHIAFDVPEQKIEEYQQRLEDAGVEVTKVVNHDDSPQQASPTITDSTFVRSVYFLDPDGIMLEFACWTRELDERDVNWDPAESS